MDSRFVSIAERLEISSCLRGWLWEFSQDLRHCCRTHWTRFWSEASPGRKCACFRLPFGFLKHCWWKSFEKKHRVSSCYPFWTSLARRTATLRPSFSSSGKSNQRGRLCFWQYTRQLRYFWFSIHWSCRPGEEYYQSCLWIATTHFHWRPGSLTRNEFLLDNLLVMHSSSDNWYHTFVLKDDRTNWHPIFNFHLW